MPLEGSLKTVGIAAMIQFPTASRRSGRLLLERDGTTAELFYVLGELHHATMGDLQGFPVLVEILPWQRGRFCFEPGIPCPGRSIDMDLGRALLQATVQGERRREEDGAEPADRPPDARDMHQQTTSCLQDHFGPRWDPATFARLSTFVAEHPVFFYACVMDRRGHVRAEYQRPLDSLEGTGETYLLLRDIMKNYALCCEDRMVVKSSHCTVAMQPFGADQVILALAAPGEDASLTEQSIALLTVSMEDPLWL